MAQVFGFDFAKLSYVFTLISVLLLMTMSDAGEKPQKRTAVIPGDIMIGALFSVHHVPAQKQAQTRTCGDIREQYGIQRVEASFQTIDQINADKNLLPNVTIGIEIRDSCWYSPIALGQSIEFIRDAINQDHEENITDIVSKNPDCPVKPVKTFKNLIGVIGPGSSTVTIQVQNLLQLFSIPQIGYSATSRELSDKSFYKYFLRVVPSDYYQAQVMVDLVRYYNWTYVSVVHTDGNYGGSGMDSFTKLAVKAGICIATSDSLLSNAQDSVFDNVVGNLRKYPNAKVVVCFCEGMTVRGMLKSIRRLNATGEFILIGSDGWSDRYDVTEEYEQEAVGGLSIRIHSTMDLTFDQYYFSLKPHQNERNPWFKEFWEFRFNCSLDNTTFVLYNRSCNGTEQVQDRYKQDTKMSFVKKAIYTMAYGLHDMQRAMCHNTSRGLCPEMLPINGSLFLQYLLNVSFVWENETVRFDRNGDPPGRYDIMNFQHRKDKGYYYKRVGSWNSDHLQWLQPIQFHIKDGDMDSELPESVCSKPCDRGKVKSIQAESVKCCWVCVACKENQYLLDEYTCQDCILGWWPNDNLTDCYPIPEEYIQWTDGTAIAAMSIAILGFIATFFTMVVFIKHNNTPVVKASTRELSYVIMVGMYLSYACTFPLLAKPTQLSCFLTRVLPGLSFSMMYASLLTKTNRIARILAGSKKKIITKKPRFMSATAQVVITWMLISIESGIVAAMLVLEPANSMYYYPTLSQVNLICNTTTLGIIAPLGFDFFLIAMCTLYAVKTRNLPENFNEAKFIGFTMYTTLVIWTAFVPIYFGSNSKVITMCLCISFSAFVALLLLFCPKLYIILLRPERNNRSAFTTTKDVRCHIGYQSTAVSRNSSHSTSEFSLESPRNLSLDVVQKGQHHKADSSNDRRPSMNIFERFRISKQAKIAANVAQHIRAVRAAEALDRRTHFRRTDSFNLPDLGLTGVLPAQRNVSNGTSPGNLRAIPRNTMAICKHEQSDLVINPKEDAGCQTSYDLLEALLPQLRRRVMRSETMISAVSPEDEVPRRHQRSESCYQRHPLFGSSEKYRNYPHISGGACAQASKIIRNKSNGRPKPSKEPSSSTSLDQLVLDHSVELVDSIDLNDIISLKEAKRSRALQLLGKRSQYNKLQQASSRMGPSSDVSGIAGFSPTISQDSLIEANSSIIEESASTGSDETPGSAVYKNIIISLGGSQEKSRNTTADNSIDGDHLDRTLETSLEMAESISRAGEGWVSPSGRSQWQHGENIST